MIPTCETCGGVATVDRDEDGLCVHCHVFFHLDPDGPEYEQTDLGWWVKFDGDYCGPYATKTEAAADLRGMKKWAKKNANG